MKFPITRECLQAFDYVKDQDELKAEGIQLRFTQIIDQLCKEFNESMRSNSNEKKFVWRQLMTIREFKYTVSQNKGLHGYSSKTDEYLPQFIEKLKEVFIGCDIIIDPLKTYLIIDWS
jgi:hypothetical protein